MSSAGAAQSKVGAVKPAVAPNVGARDASHSRCTKAAAVVLYVRLVRVGVVGGIVHRKASLGVQILLGHFGLQDATLFGIDLTVQSHRVSFSGVFEGAVELKHLTAREDISRLKRLEP